MQTLAERHLVQQTCDFLHMRRDSDLHYPILNIGAGKSVSIEEQISSRGCKYVCDRIDIDDCSVIFPNVGNCLTCSVEEMTPVGTNGYYLAFANYVLEHVENLHKAVHEIYRVLCPSGIFVTSLPNPAAPEFIFARYSPLWFHRMIRQSEAWETVYSYSSISELTSVFESEGFIILDVKYWPITEGYLWRYPIVSNFSGRYDRMVSKLNIKRLMGSVCITVKKPAA